MSYRLSSILLITGLAYAAGPSYAQSPSNTAAPSAVQQTPSDNATVAANVKAALLRGPEAPGLDVKVAARDGTVTLSGTVRTDTERDNAERIARARVGVTTVENRMRVREKDSAGDRLNPVGTGSNLPRTSPTPATPGAPALPNGAAAPPVPGG